MDLEAVERIKNKIKKAELESAKAAGMLENMQKSWKEKYGTSDISKIKEILSAKEEELEAKRGRMDKLYADLLNAYNWSEI